MASILINSVFNTQVSKTHYVSVYTVYNHGPPAVTWPNWMRTNIPMTPFVNGFKKKPQTFLSTDIQCSTEKCYQVTSQM